MSARDFAIEIAAWFMAAIAFYGLYRALEWVFYTIKGAL